jgi:hypothetical protein
MRARPHLNETIKQLNQEIVALRKQYQQTCSDTKLEQKKPSLRDKISYEKYICQFNDIIDKHTTEILEHQLSTKKTKTNSTTPLLLRDQGEKKAGKLPDTIAEYETKRAQRISYLQTKYGLAEKHVKKIFNLTGSITHSLLDNTRLVHLEQDDLRIEVSHKSIQLTKTQKKHYRLSGYTLEWATELDPLIADILKGFINDTLNMSKDIQIADTKNRQFPGLANPTHLTIKLQDTSLLTTSSCAISVPFKIQNSNERLTLTKQNLNQWIAYCLEDSPQLTKGSRYPIPIITFLSPIRRRFSLPGFGACGLSGDDELEILITLQSAIADINLRRKDVVIIHCNIPQDQVGYSPCTKNPNLAATLNYLSENLHDKTDNQSINILRLLQAAALNPKKYCKLIPLLIFVLFKLINPKILIKHNCKSNKDRGGNFLVSLVALTLLAYNNHKEDHAESATGNAKKKETPVNSKASIANGISIIAQYIKSAACIDTLHNNITIKRRELVLQNYTSLMSDEHLGLAAKVDGIEYTSNCLMRLFSDLPPHSAEYGTQLLQAPALSKVD